MNASSPGRGTPPPGTVKIRLEGSPEDLAGAVTMLSEAFGSDGYYLDARLYQNREDPCCRMYGALGIRPAAALPRRPGIPPSVRTSS